MPTERQLDIILESELEFKTFKEEPMSNNKLPTDAQERIKADAERYTKDEGYQRVYIAGATAENDRAQVLVDALSDIASGKVLPQFIASMALEQWKSGKGKEVTKPEPEGCPYCGSSTCTSDHK